MIMEMVADLSGFSALQQVNTPNLTVAYVILKPFDERRRSATEINKELNAKFANIKEGFTYALMPPPIVGLGNGSGYSLYLEDRAGLGYGALQNALNTFQSTVAQTPGMTFPVSTYQANIPQLEVQGGSKSRLQGCKGLRYPICSTPCKPTSARSISTTSMCSVVSTESWRRPMPPIVNKRRT